MDILVNVINQKLNITLNQRCIVEGTQQFVRFIFNLSDEWNDLHPFAQFIQNNEAYNVYLDSDNAVYLPSEIVSGQCIMLLYGSAGNVKATTNYLTLTIDKSLMVADAQSTVITQSLYDQMVAYVNAYDDVIEEIQNNAGLLTNLHTEAKNNLVSAINEVHDELDTAVTDYNNKIGNTNTNLGDLTTLITTDKTSAVNAINEVKTSINNMGNIVGISYTVVSTW